MPVPELQKFREKYPGYDDMNDAELARRLAAKYPEYRDLPSKITAQPELTDAEFTKVRQQSAIQEPAFQSLARATIPTIGTLASFLVPGSGLAATAAQSAISGGATAANQALGLEPKDLTQVGIAAAIPAIGNLAMRGIKGGGTALGKLFAPAAAKEAGIEAIAETAGSPATSAARIFTEPASRKAYAAVKAAGPVPTAGIVSVLDDTINQLDTLSNKPQAAIKYLKNMVKKYGAVGPGMTAEYDDVVKELQLLKANADNAMKGNKPTARALYEARQAILNQLDQISPAVKTANALYAKEQATQEIVNAVRTGNSGAKIRNLLENDPSIVRSLRATPKDVDEMVSLADEISNMATASIGITNRVFNAVSAPLGRALATPAGRALIRKTMQPTGKLTPAGIATIVQFMRAYSAQEAAGHAEGR